MKPEAASGTSPAPSEDVIQLETLYGERFIQLLKYFMYAQGICGVSVATVFFIHLGPRLENIAGFLLAGLSVIALKMLARGNARQALQVMLWGLWVVFGVWMGLVMGVKTPIAMGYPLLITLTGWLVGMRSAAVMTTMTIAVVTGVYALQSLGVLPERVAREPLAYAVTIITITVLGAIFSGFLSAGFRHQLTRVSRLGQDLQAKVGELEKSKAEISSLNAGLEERVEERTRDLEAALATLKETRGELLQYEKMASLGSIVAGVSHELNTPIGNALMASTGMSQDAEQILQSLRDGTLAKSRMEDFLVVLIQNSEIVERSCARAASLINSFKQIAIDQTSERRREFRLHQVVDDVVASLRPVMKNRNILVESRIPDHIVCDGFPGPLSQVFMNLIQNAQTHAFEGQEHGTIRITAHVDEAGMVRAEVHDDGVGMDSKTLSSIFDPFFTTKLGRGGSGLGLSISHRIMTEILRGNLNVWSKLAQGSVFTLHFPRITPDRL